METSLRERYEHHYLPRLAAFTYEIGEVDAVGIQELHLPLWGKNYSTADLKLAFIGIETKGWGGMNGMVEFIREAKTNPRAALYRTEGEFRELPFTEWTNNFGSTFWDTVMQFLAVFYNLPDWRELKKRQHDEILHNFVWAETNAAEAWHVTAAGNKADITAWKKIKSASEKHLDSFSAILHIFRPQVAIIMNWGVADDYWDCPLQFERIGEHVDYALDCAHGTHVFHIAHPNFLRGDRRSKTFESITKKWEEFRNCAGQ